ncbi:hypothetical protein E4T56_gene77, partial [Termitomyces sp. T112]
MVRVPEPGFKHQILHAAGRTVWIFQANVRLVNITGTNMCARGMISTQAPLLQKIRKIARICNALEL